MAKQKEGLHKYTKPQLIEFIELYNLATHISNYRSMKKQQLIDAINAKFTINDKGEIQIRPDLKTSVKKSTKVVKQQKKKLEDLDELELSRLLGSLRGEKTKLEDDVKELTEDIRVEKEDKDEPDENLINENKKYIENIKPQIKALKEEINKVIDLIKAVRAREEPKEQKQKKKDDKKKLLQALTKKYAEPKLKEKVKDILEKDKREQDKHNEENKKIMEQIKKLDEQFKKKPQKNIEKKAKNILEKNKKEQERHNKEGDKLKKKIDSILEKDKRERRMHIEEDREVKQQIKELDLQFKRVEKLDKNQQMIYDKLMKAKNNNIRYKRVEEELDKLYETDEENPKIQKLENERDRLEDEKLDISLTDNQIKLLIGKYNANILIIGLINYFIKEKISFGKITNRYTELKDIMEDFVKLTYDNDKEIDISYLFTNGLDFGELESTDDYDAEFISSAYDFLIEELEKD